MQVLVFYKTLDPWFVSSMVMVIHFTYLKCTKYFRRAKFKPWYDLVLLVLGERRKLNFYGNVLYKPLFGLFDWSIILAPLMIDFQVSKFCGIGLGVWPLFGVKFMIFLEEFLFQTCSKIQKVCFTNSFFFCLFLLL